MVTFLFIAFQKTFDTLGNSILMGKLKYYGLRDPAYNWLM